MDSQCTRFRLRLAVCKKLPSTVFISCCNLQTTTIKQNFCTYYYSYTQQQSLSFQPALLYHYNIIKIQTKLEDMRFGHIVVGPAGHGKTTYCKTIIHHAETINRKVDFVNLDPANDNMEGSKNIVFDVRDFVNVDQIMQDEQLNLGPNGALVYAMELLLDNTSWITEQLGDYDDDYILFDCPGQIELHTHYDVIKRLVRLLESLNFRLCGVFVLDSGFFLDTGKFFSATLCTLSTMVNIEIPFFNILTKTDLLNERARKQLDEYLEPDTNFLFREQSSWSNHWSKKYKKLTKSLARLIDDYSLVKFVPMNMFEEESLNDILFAIDQALQYDEEREVKVRDFDE